MTLIAVPPSVLPLLGLTLRISVDTQQLTHVSIISSNNDTRASVALNQAL